MCPEPYAGPLHAGGPRRNAPTPLIPKGHNTGKWRLITDLPPPRAQHQRCHYVRGVLPLLHHRRAGGGGGGRLHQGSAIGENRHRGGIPPHTGSSARSSTASGGMGREVLRRPDAPIRALLGPKNFNAVADALEWCLRSGVCGRGGFDTSFITSTTSLLLAPLIPLSAPRRCLSSTKRAPTWEFQSRTTSGTVLRLASRTWASRWTQWPPNYVFRKTSSSASGSASLNGVIGNAAGGGNSSPSSGSCTMRAKWFVPAARS